MRTLITGAEGFIGGYLSQFLRQQGEDFFGTYYKGGSADLIGCDVRDAEAVDSMIRDIKPERIYHLAAQSLPTISWKEPALTMETNITGTINIFESLLRHGLKPRVLVACSSAEYGFVSEEDVPVKEDHSLKPLHPYGVSKVAQDLLAYQYFANFGIPSVRVRIFNTTGPGKTDDVCSDFARRIVSIEKGNSPPIVKVGNLHTRREVIDVRDAVRGLYLALEKGEEGEVYNLSSGRVFQISYLLEVMLSLTKQKLHVEVDQRLLRPSDEPVIMGANAKLRKATGWQCVIPLEKTLEDILNYWRQR
jgi:GDP-4-dehydro-6-deoxy-D-mannose reductase